MVYACSHLCLLCSSCSVIYCMLICTVCAAYIAYAFHTMSHVMSVIIPWSYLSQVLETTSYVAMHLCAHVTTCFWEMPLLPWALRGSPLCADQEAGGFCSLFTQTEDSSTLRQPGSVIQPVLPGSVDNYLPVPDCTLQKSVNAQILRAFNSADIGITTNTTSDFSSTCVVLALVAGRQDFQP